MKRTTVRKILQIMLIIIFMPIWAPTYLLYRFFININATLEWIFYSNNEYIYNDIRNTCAWKTLDKIFKDGK